MPVEEGENDGTASADSARHVGRMNPAKLQHESFGAKTGHLKGTTRMRVGLHKAMKIFFVGYHNPHFLTFCEYNERAIAGLGHDLAVYDYRDWLIPGRIRDRAPALHRWDMQRINRTLIAKVKRFQPDVVIVTGGWTISAQTITHIRQTTRAVTVNWVADFPLLFEVYEKVGPYYDFFFVSTTEALERYRKNGNTNGYWLPFACDPEIHQKIDLTKDEFEKYKRDVCFIGTGYKERIETLEHLTDFNLGIWGPKWEELPKRSPLRKFVRGGAVQPREWVKILSASKIGLNIFGTRYNIPELAVDGKKCRMTNTRLFEILGCGVLQIANRREDAVRLFKDGEHICYFQDNKELKGLVRKYLNEPQERERIALAGQREAVEKHTYKHRIEEILATIQRERR